MKRVVVTLQVIEEVIMKVRFLAVLPMLMVGAYNVHADEGHWQNEMIQHIFGNNPTITKEEFVKKSADKFDKIDVGKTGKISKEQFLAFVKEQKDKAMKEKYCK